MNIFFVKRDIIDFFSLFYRRNLLVSILSNFFPTGLLVLHFQMLFCVDLCK